MPGLAKEILEMAKRAQKANHSASLLPLRAEAIAYVTATVGVTMLPWILIGAAVFLALKGFDIAAIVTGVAGIVASGPQIIAATRRQFGSPPKQPQL